MQKNPLFDTDFLLKLDKIQNRILYVKITTLTWDETPIGYIEGQITGGSINIDGSSSLRRTCSLTMVAQDIDLNNYYQGLNTKFKLEIGLKNTIDSQYPEMIWFPQGIFIFTSFNTSISTNNYTISLSGKDKMCLLNGDVSGALNSSVDFGVEEYYDKLTQTTTYTNIPVKDIVKNIVHIYGKEPLHNIIINDIDDCGYELLNNYGDTDIYLFKKVSTGIFTNMSVNANQPCYLLDNTPTTIGALSRYDTLISIVGTEPPTKIKMRDMGSADIYTIAKIQPGEVAGYRLTDLTYPGDLISKVGETITSILDKIKNMLGTFEYFYDIEGKFVFQKKKVYTQGNFSLIYKGDGEQYALPAAGSSEYAYEFVDLRNFTTVSNTPVLNNLKNDFSVWGVRKSVSGADISVLMRYALDRKPIRYSLIEISEEDSLNLIDNLGYPFTPSANNLTNEEINTEKKNKYKQSGIYTVEDYDWRELIYQMAKDYFQFNQLDDFYQRVAAANPVEYPSGYTGYEQYYTDIQGFWRQLYNPDFEVASSEADANLTYYEFHDETYIAIDEAVEIKIPGNTTYYDKNGNQYDIFEAFNEDKEYYIKENENLILFNIYKFKDSFIDQTLYVRENDDDYDPITFWNYDVRQNPAVLNFWFDFMSEDTALEKFSVPVIGSRSKAVSDKDVCGIYFTDTPSVLFVSNDQTQQQFESIQSGYTYINLNESLQNMFTISSQGKSAFNAMEELLYEHIYCSETISITSIPIFYLQPNVKIKVFDDRIKVNDDYLVSKISLSLAHNGMMSISAVKVANPLY